MQQSKIIDTAFWSRWPLILWPITLLCYLACTLRCQAILLDEFHHKLGCFQLIVSLRPRPWWLQIGKEEKWPFTAPNALCCAHFRSLIRCCTQVSSSNQYLFIWILGWHFASEFQEMSHVLTKVNSNIKMHKFIFLLICNEFLKLCP